MPPATPELTVATTTGPSDTDRSRPPPDLIKLVTSIGSPIALISALLFYFGWARSERQAKEFGADASVFAMSTDDYVLRSVDALFLPLVFVLLLLLLAFRLDRWLRGGGTSSPRLRHASRALRWSGLVLVPLGLAGFGASVTAGQLTVRVCWLLAVLLTGYGYLLRRDATGTPQALSRRSLASFAVLVTAMLFWFTEGVASAYGAALARDLQSHLADELNPVVLFSAKDLHLDGSGVEATPLAGAESAYTVRYTGLYLLQRSGDKYFLLTDGWSQDQGRLIVLPDTPGIRVEFGP